MTTIERTAASPLDPATFDSESVAHLMGTTAHVMVRGEGDPELQMNRLLRLEHLWSRFIDNSELSRLGRLDGTPAVVSGETALLIARSVDAWRRTAGLFDATMLGHLEAAGYDRSFEFLEHVRSDGAASERTFVATGAEAPAGSGGGETNLLIEADAGTGLVRLPAGVRIDPGGIGKGLAADLVAVQALRDGATGVLVSVGGDLRTVGAPPDQGWEIELDHHTAGPARINLRDGAVATSTRLGRRWRSPSGISHHVIDPRTHRPSTGPAVAVSVVAAEAWWAEAVATAVLIGFGTPGFDELSTSLLAGAGVLVTTADRRRHCLGPLGSAFLVPDDTPIDFTTPHHADRPEDRT